MCFQEYNCVKVCIENLIVLSQCQRNKKYYGGVQCPYQLGNKCSKETKLNIWRNENYFSILLFINKAIKAKSNAKLFSMMMSIKFWQILSNKYYWSIITQIYRLYQITGSAALVFRGQDVPSQDLQVLQAKVRFKTQSFEVLEVCT